MQDTGINPRIRNTGGSIPTTTRTLLNNIWYTDSLHHTQGAQKECARLREGVPYANVYRYNPKHLYPKWKVYGDNGHTNLKLWQLLLTYWLTNTYWNWQEYMVSIMIKAVRNIKVNCEWHKAIKLMYKNARTRVRVVISVPSTIHESCIPSRVT